MMRLTRVGWVPAQRVECIDLAVPGKEVKGLKKEINAWAP